ncbi:LysR family transcriptional regulator [Psychrobacillus sp. NEAU-3TGS]|uniref:LysR family transcriptional regulator n=1 Tax=Psychrobacillus sp. NEAU-3TGS TaxID=2995412 RepID=UPI002496C3CD|nr:LysR family transcriptional regulator [Psychrobacillus sp. NEAU-3TGS]MDI2587567.1 LysR family transcriptional regulator [Psychrobacillus sp. NEAU-3TGS]
MEPKILNYVITLANEKNFTKAARKLHLAQPSLSYQISKLEKELGILLFNRENEVSLTYAGKVFISHARQIINQFQQLNSEIIDVAEMKKGQLLVGSLAHTGAYMLPKTISRFKDKFPGIDLVLIEDTSVNLQLLISSGQLEIGLMSMPITNSELEKETILEEDILLAIPTHHWLASYEEVDLKDCKDEHFILIKEGNHFRKNTYDLCVQSGFEPKIVFESININTCQSLVTAGVGISFVPRMVVNEIQLTNKPIYLPIKTDKINPKREIVIAYKNNRYLSKAARAFINTMSELYN